MYRQGGGSPAWWRVAVKIVYMHSLKMMIVFFRPCTEPFVINGETIAQVDHLTVNKFVGTTTLNDLQLENDVVSTIN